MYGLAWAVIGRRAEDRQTELWLRLVQTLRSWRWRIHARRALRQIDHRTLCDAGIDPMAAQYEATQPFWIAERRLRDR